MSRSSDTGAPRFLNRRHVLAMLIAAAVVPPRAIAAQSIAGTRSAVSASSLPSITRAAVIHDALLLLASDRDVTGEWQDALLPLPVGKPFEFSYAYGTAMLGDDPGLVRDVVAEVRDGWAGREAPFMDIQRHKLGMMERRFSVALGWAANRAATRTLFADSQVTQALVLAFDGELLRAISGVRKPAKAEAQRVFRVLYERALVGMHTVEPDLDGLGGLDIAAMHEVKKPQPEDVNRYIDDYADWIEGIDERCEQLAAAFASPPPRGIPTGNGFYAAEDAIIAVATAIRSGSGIAHPPNRWAADAGTSRFANAVSNAYAAARIVLEAARGDRPVADVDGIF